MAKNESKAAEDRRDVFISYSSKDKAIAEKLRQAVNSLQYTTFFDEVALPGSPEWEREIVKSIKNCRMVLFYRTENSVTSEWCARELHLAEGSHKKIVPVVNRSRQSSLPDSDALQALLVNRQSTFIDEEESPSVLRENLRQTLENVLGKGTGSFGEMPTVLHDMLRQAAAAMNITFHTDAIQYSCNGPDDARFYRDFWFGDQGVEFQMICRRMKRFRSTGNCKKCDRCKTTQKGGFVIDTSIKYLSREEGYLAEEIERKIREAPEGGDTGWQVHDCSRSSGAFRERLLAWTELGGSDSYPAVLRLICKANESFAIWEKIIGGLQKKAEMWDKFLNAFQTDSALEDVFFIYKEGTSLLLVPKKTRSVIDRSAELGIYDSIELLRPDVIRIYTDKLYSEAPTIKFDRYKLNRVVRASYDIRQFVDDIEARKWEDSVNDLKAGIRSIINDLQNADMEYRKSWQDERRPREMLKQLIGKLTKMHVGDWEVSSDHEKKVFTAIGKYKYCKTAKDPAEIVSPLRIRIVMNREGELRAGFAVFHVDEPSAPKFDFEQPGGVPGKCVAAEEGASDFRLYFPELTTKDGNPQYFSQVIGESGNNPCSNSFVQRATDAWEKILYHIEESGKGKSTLAARRTAVYKKFREFFRRQGGFVVTSLDGRTIEEETDGDRIAWLLEWDHRFYRDLSKLADDAIPFCPFVQLIGPGVGRWSTGWTTTREFRNLPRSVKHFFWHSLFGDNAWITSNGNSVYFNRADIISEEVLDKAMRALKEIRDPLAYLWKCLSDPDFSKAESGELVKKFGIVSPPSAEKSPEKCEAISRG